MKKKKKIVISAGGTLGHILPIIPVVYDIYNEYDLYFIGTKKGMEESYFKNNDLNKYFKKTYFLDVDGIDRKNIFNNFKTLYKYLLNKNIIKKIYKEVKPSLIIGMGGYISGICINIASNNNIKTIIHEQNAVLGLANKLVINKVDKLLLSFPITNINKKNTKLIGNPRYSYIKENYNPIDEDVIIIFGGSLGSKYINDLIINNIDDLRFKNYKIKLIVGKKYYNENIDIINKVNNNYYNIKIYDFLNNLIDEMSKATLIISRSGASTLCEIIALKKPSILIPSPNVTKNHQYFNALELIKKNCCKMIEEKDLDIKKLKEEIIQFITNNEYKNEIITNLNNFYNNNPKEEFINVIKELIC